MTWATARTDSSRSPVASNETHQEQVANGVTVEFAHAEAVLEGRGQRILGIGERPETLAQVPDRGDVEHGAKPPGRASVVGDRDHASDVAREGAARAGHGGAVSPADRDDLHRAMSR
jgi:hypothetical protein